MKPKSYKKKPHFAKHKNDTSIYEIFLCHYQNTKHEAW